MTNKREIVGGSFVGKSWTDPKKEADLRRINKSTLEAALLYECEDIIWHARFQMARAMDHQLMESLKHD